MATPPQKPKTELKMVYAYVTQAEYKKLMAHKPLTADGSVSAAIRGQLGLPELPRGWGQWDRYWNYLKEQER